MLRNHRKLPAIASVTLVAIGLTLSNCGFKPLYGRHSSTANTGMIDRLATIRINPIANRVGQQLRNRLLDRMNPQGSSKNPTYVLTIRLKESTRHIAFRRDEIATRANLNLTATYALREISSGAFVFRANSQATTSYNVLDADFATLSARSQARVRAVTLLSDAITTRLAVFLNQVDASKAKAKKR